MHIDEKCVILRYYYPLHHSFRYAKIEQQEYLLTGQAQTKTEKRRIIFNEETNKWSVWNHCSPCPTDLEHLYQNGKSAKIA